VFSATDSGVDIQYTFIAFAFGKVILQPVSMVCHD